MKPSHSGRGISSSKAKNAGTLRLGMIAGSLAVASAVPQIRAGRLRPLGVSSPKRSAAIPEVPTISESGLDSFEAGSWFGFFAPAKTPREIVTKLHGEIISALKLPGVQERLATLGLDPVGNTPAQFSEQIRRDLAKWGKVVKAAGIHPE